MTRQNNNGIQQVNETNQNFNANKNNKPQTLNNS